MKEDTVKEIMNFYTFMKNAELRKLDASSNIAKNDGKFKL